MSKTYSLLQITRVAWRLATTKERRKAISILILDVFINLLDLVSLAAILPVFLSLLSPTEEFLNFLPESWRESILPLPRLQIQLTGLGIVLALFLVKNFMAYVFTRRRIFFLRRLAIRLNTMAFQGFFAGTTLQEFLQKKGGEDLHSLVFIPNNFISIVVKGLFTIVKELTLVIALVISMLIFDPTIFLTAVLALGPGLIALVLLRRKRLGKLSNKSRPLYNQFLQFINEHIRGYLDIVMSGRRSSFVARFETQTSGFHLHQGAVETLSQTSNRVTEAVAIVGISGILGYLAVSQASAAYTSLSLGVYIAGTYKLIPSLNRILTSYTQAKAHAYTAEEVQELTRPSPAEEEHSLPFEKELRFEQMEFAYPNVSFKLRELDFHWKKGEKIALVGPSGSGKTTLIHLIIGLFQPTAGHITVDGKPLTLERGMQWRNQISYVSQMPLLLESSLAENIAFGVPESEINRDRIIQIIREVHLQPLVAQLSDGIDTPLGEGALRISAGQRQRVALARALYQDRPIMIFDEITSHLDEETEKDMVEMLVALAQGNKTLLFITHRPYILQHCDRVLQLKGGKLKEQGETLTDLEVN